MGFCLLTQIFAPILGLSRRFVKTPATDKYGICLVFLTFWQKMVLEGDRLKDADLHPGSKPPCPQAF
ncbi:MULTISPECIES: hypothetical protein [Microcoleaceae]|uniref:hypothetical protein n=1 Tax=Microcoleaceae TaxID=1892252 RepID=UPI00188133B0|nr:hypothetical protein [Tychonema sp. LEGE 06208]MBE9163449.1 hypothetical protein [Tychonema sp. LEGE 06208]